MNKLDQLAEAMKLLSDKTRLTILAYLKEREMCVCDIVELLETTQPNVSQHLRKLKTGGLVRETKRSQWSYYALNLEDKPYLQPVLDQLPSMKNKLAARTNPSCD
ncbi:ArsR family transcriptional regulator [Paenibacillus nanensis]|uniref:ArsR family transcriptional regulator n=1 Tax=Paenibacillus nanensis TaxID=393251 RepID=A0A3A1VIF9_9BACL|nr:metalloregulator ArsR/SmtB family transcription factor [Paenibacillus nanensis]RIX60094.1 ArsR family transcriptional regulator [Paenibacillus nanensis]